MDYEETSKYCTFCQRDILARRSIQRVNDILHLLLTLVTGGLWLLVWIFMSKEVGEWRCSSCGKVIPEEEKVKKTPILNIIIILLFVVCIAIFLAIFFNNYNP